MKSFSLFLAVIVAASALAGCADNDQPDNTLTTPTGTTPTQTTPTDVTPATPTTPTDVTPTTPTGEPPAPVECTGDYVDESAMGERNGLPELRYTTQDPSAEDPCYAFIGPRNATAGWTAITLAYPAGGREFHIMPMYFIGERTMGELMQAMGASQGAPPEWATPVGAVGGVTPGQNGTVVMELEEGNYVFYCPINGHHMQGMTGQLTVANSTEERAEPEALVTVELTDYNFTIPEMRDDVKVIRVTNNGSEPHEAPLVRLNAGTNITQFVQAIESPTGPPPGVLIGGVNAIAPGETVYLLVDLEADTEYGFVCFVPSPAHGGAPHIAIGPMLAQFDVEHNEADQH